jgi:hypothetical protein
VHVWELRWGEGGDGDLYFEPVYGDGQCEWDWGRKRFIESGRDQLYLSCQEHRDDYIVESWDAGGVNRGSGCGFSGIMG